MKENKMYTLYLLVLKIDPFGTGKYYLKISEDIEIKNQFNEFLLAYLIV